MDKMPIVTLVSGLRVGNFSSAHPFTFVTGEVLPACSPERARALMLATQETETRRARWSSGYGTTEWVEIELTFGMSEEVRSALAIDSTGLDVLLVPLPVRQAIKAEVARVREMMESYSDRVTWDDVERIARTCRVADRVTKVIYGDRFCL